MYNKRHRTLKIFDLARVVVNACISLASTFDVTLVWKVRLRERVSIVRTDTDVKFREFAIASKV